MPNRLRKDQKPWSQAWRVLLPLVIVTSGLACGGGDDAGLGLEARPRFEALVEESDLADGLVDLDGEITVLVPSDAALAAARRDRPDDFADADRRAFVVKLHVLEGRWTRSELEAEVGGSVRSIAGLALPIARTGGRLTVGGRTVGTELRDAEGVLALALGGVLLPPER